MKKLLILPLALCTLMFVACGGDDDCLAADFVGTYTGTEVCNGGTATDVTVEVTAGSSDSEVIVNGITASVDGCDLTATGEDATGLTINYTASLSDSTLTWTAKTDIPLLPDLECIITATK